VQHKLVTTIQIQCECWLDKLSLYEYWYESLKHLKQHVAWKRLYQNLYSLEESTRGALTNQGCGLWLRQASPKVLLPRWKKSQMETGAWSASVSSAQAWSGADELLWWRGWQQHVLFVAVVIVSTSTQLKMIADFIFFFPWLVGEGHACSLLAESCQVEEEAVRPLPTGSRSVESADFHSHNMPKLAARGGRQLSITDLLLLNLV
jgi:hypothetical protein